jgi:hypothetical protein
MLLSRAAIALFFVDVVSAGTPAPAKSVCDQMKAAKCTTASSDSSGFQIRPLSDHMFAAKNECEGKKPGKGAGFDNWECVKDEVVQATEQSGADVTEGYTGKLQTNHKPITTTYHEAGLCPVNVHWHLGAEHRSEGEFDECGSGPTYVDHHRDEGETRRLASPLRHGLQCHHYDNKTEKFTKEYDWQHCIDMHVGETYEVHWPHSNAGACGTPNQFQTPFYDGVLCRMSQNPKFLTELPLNVGVQAQVFTIVNDEDYFYPDLMWGMIVHGDYGKNLTKYTGSTTGTTRNNTMCSKYTPITWQVDRKCHLISASSFDKMCADMKMQRDDMSGDLYAHGSRVLVQDTLVANNQHNRRLGVDCPTKTTGTNAATSGTGAATATTAAASGTGAANATTGATSNVVNATTVAPVEASASVRSSTPLGALLVALSCLRADAKPSAVALLLISFAVQATAGVSTPTFAASTCTQMESAHGSCNQGGHQVVPAPVFGSVFAAKNECEGKKPGKGAGFDNWECVKDEVVQATEQAGADVTVGYKGKLQTNHKPINTTYLEAGLCPVNVHWHLGAEHRSDGEFDENGSGPTYVDHHRDEGETRRLASPLRHGLQCHHYDNKTEKYTKEYDWQHCIDMHVGETYEVHWPHSNAGACGTPDQFQTPFYDGVLCRMSQNPKFLTELPLNVGVQAQVFTIVNDESYYYPNLMRGMIVEGEMGKHITKYTGSTTGTTRNNTMCSKYTPITWQVDRKCHLISASSFDKMCADMKMQRDDMSGDLYAHGSRVLVNATFVANNQHNRRLLR